MQKFGYFEELTLTAALYPLSMSALPTLAAACVRPRWNGRERSVER